MPINANNIIELPSLPKLLDNVTYPYCEIILDEDYSNKEHIIARKFVPKGSLDRN